MQARQLRASFACPPTAPCQPPCIQRQLFHLLCDLHFAALGVPEFFLPAREGRVGRAVLARRRANSFVGVPYRPYESALQWPAAAAVALLLWQSPYAGLVRGFLKVCVAAPCTTSVTACGRQRMPGWQQGKTWGLGPLDKRRSFCLQTVRPRRQDQRAVSGRHTLTGTLWCMVLRCPCCLFKQ